jgi:hypothetical protein
LLLSCMGSAASGPRTRRKMVTIGGNRRADLGGRQAVTAWRSPVLLVAGVAGLIALQPVRVSAQWWSRAPADFEECADAAEKSASKEEKSAALAACNAKFAARRKPGGGYTYYDFMQDRTFDIAGPNPTPEEQRYIDEQYTLYLESQRRSSIAAAFSAKQQQQVEEASLHTEMEKVPIPRERPTKIPSASSQAGAQGPSGESHSLRGANCPRHTFSCEWPRLSEGLNDIKKLFNSQPTKTAKKS